VRVSLSSAEKGKIMSIIRGSGLPQIETPGGNRTTALATPSRGASELSIILQRQQPGGMNPAHHHDREEVMVMLSGEVALILNDEPRGLVGGDIAIIPAPIGLKIEVRSRPSGFSSHRPVCASFTMVARKPSPNGHDNPDRTCSSCADAVSHAVNVDALGSGRFGCLATGPSVRSGGTCGLESG